MIDCNLQCARELHASACGARRTNGCESKKEQQREGTAAEQNSTSGQGKGHSEHQTEAGKERANQEARAGRCAPLYPRYLCRRIQPMPPADSRQQTNEVQATATLHAQLRRAFISVCIAALLFSPPFAPLCSLLCPRRCSPSPLHPSTLPSTERKRSIAFAHYRYPSPLIHLASLCRIVTSAMMRRRSTALVSSHRRDSTTNNNSHRKTSTYKRCDPAHAYLLFASD